MRRQVLLFGNFDWCRSRINIKSKSTLCLGKVGVTGSSANANVTGSFSQSERKSIQEIQRFLGCVSETWAMKVEDMTGWERTVDVWCSLT